MKKLFTKFHPNLNNKSILITGGTGSFGKHFVKRIMSNFNPKLKLKKVLNSFAYSSELKGSLLNPNEVKKIYTDETVKL